MMFRFAALTAGPDDVNFTGTMESVGGRTGDSNRLAARERVNRRVSAGIG